MRDGIFRPSILYSKDRFLGQNIPFSVILVVTIVGTGRSKRSTSLFKFSGLSAAAATVVGKLRLKVISHCMILLCVERCRYQDHMGIGWDWYIHHYQYYGSSMLAIPQEIRSHFLGDSLHMSKPQSD